MCFSLNYLLFIFDSAICIQYGAREEGTPVDAKQQKRAHVTARRNLYKELKKRTRLRTASGLLNFWNTMGTYVTEKNSTRLLS